MDTTSENSIAGNDIGDSLIRVFSVFRVADYSGRTSTAGSTLDSASPGQITRTRVPCST